MSIIILLLIAAGSFFASISAEPHSWNQVAAVAGSFSMFVAGVFLGKDTRK